MSTSDTSKQLQTVEEYSYILQYELTHSINPAYEEYELYEYGIRCQLFDESHSLLSEAQVAHISPNRSFVTSLLNKILEFKVFPVHLLDVVSDELIKSVE